jgi:hypothetical protein
MVYVWSERLDVNVDLEGATLVPHLTPTKVTAISDACT